MMRKLDRINRFRSHTTFYNSRKWSKQELWFFNQFRISGTDGLSRENEILQNFLSNLREISLSQFSKIALHL